RRLKAPAPHGFQGGFVQLRVSCRAYHLDVFYSPLRRNTHLQKHSALDPPSPGRLGIARLDLISPYRAGRGATPPTTYPIARSAASSRPCTTASTLPSTGTCPPAPG